MQTICFYRESDVHLRLSNSFILSSDGLIVSLFSYRFLRRSSTWAAIRNSVPSNWLSFHSFLFENVTTELPYFLFQFGMEAEVVYFYSQVVVFVLWKCSNNHTEHSFAFTMREILLVATGVRSKFFLDGLSRAEFLYIDSISLHFIDWDQTVVQVLWAEFTRQYLFGLPLFSGQSSVTSISHRSGHLVRGIGACRPKLYL